MRVKFWGVRGSTPTPQTENLRYGGNTSCVEVRLGDQIYIFDCGTGFRVLGRELKNEFGDRPFAAQSSFRISTGITFRACRSSARCMKIRTASLCFIRESHAQPRAGDGRADGFALLPG